MDIKKRKTIPFTKSVWKGKEIDHRTDRVNVKLRINPRKRDEELTQKIGYELSERLVGEIERFSVKTGKIILKVPEGTDIVALAIELSRLPEVEYAEPDQVTSVTLAPGDTRYGEQWALAMINAEGAWDLERGQADVLIGVMDTGISHDGTNLAHTDLNDAARYILGTDFVSDDALPLDDNGHGTHVAGTAAAETDNASGIAGMNWGSNVYVCKIFDSTGNGSEADFEFAVQEIVDYAVANNLRAVLNLSAGWFADSGTLSDACDYANSNGMVLCVATGNEGGDLRTPAIHAVSFDGMLAVGATNSDDEVWSDSNVGPGVTVVAPGVDILSTIPPDSFDWGQGTSMATPHVTGLASLVWSRVPALTNAQVRDVIVNTAVKLGSGDFDDSWGHGRVDAAEAVAKAGWELTPVQLELQFLDVPEGKTQLRAIRIDVKSFHAARFEVSALPAAPFSMHNYTGPVTSGKTTDYDTPREVYLWVRYTGTTAGDTASGAAQVTCTTTGEVFNVTITANTIARPTCAMMLVLDRSGSMLGSSGVGTMTREEVLRYSTNIFVSSVRQNNGVGIVTFDHEAYDLLNPVEGPFGAPDDAFDTARPNTIAALSGYAANPAGYTAIGDGIERGFNNLPASGYDKKALIVFTDGHETASKYISEVAPFIDEQVFAVGLGTAQELNPIALRDICDGNDGYLLLTDQLDDDDTFKLAKYFLQIQAGVNNEDIVVDPDGYVSPGETVKIPFVLNETDISADVIVLMPAQGILEVAVETPDGDLISPANIGTFPGVTMNPSDHMTYYRMSLPVVDGASVNAHTGKWHIVLQVNKDFFEEYLKRFTRFRENSFVREYQNMVAHGIKYCALVHSYSNLRMKCTASQTSYEPGAKIAMRCSLTEYGAPLPKNSSVTANLLMPDGSSSTAVFNKVGTGLYETQVDAYFPGIYRFVMHASGFTSRNNSFTREQVLTAAVWRGGDNPPPTTWNNANDEPPRSLFCRLLYYLCRICRKRIHRKM